jgi:DGQHR domain-containing protein
MIKAIVIGDAPLHVVAILDGKELSAKSHVTAREDDDKFWQRALDESRVKQIAKKVIDEGKPFPSAVILAASGAPPKIVDGVIHFDLKESKFQIIDGQHRLMAFRYSTKSTPIIASIFWTEDQKEISKIFKDVNWNQKPLNKSLYYDLVKFSDDEKEDFYVRRAADLVAFLNDDRTSELQGKINMTGRRGGSYWITQASLGAGLEALMRKRASKFGPQSLQDQNKSLANFFSALRKSFASDFQERATIIWRPTGLRAALILLGKCLDESIVPNSREGSWIAFWESRQEFDWSAEQWKGFSSISGFTKIADDIIDFGRNDEDSDFLV